MTTSFSSKLIPTGARHGGGTGFLVALALFVSGATHSVRAQTEAFTNPRGIYTLKVAGTASGQSQARTYFGIQLLPDVRFQGLVNTVSGDAISLNGLSSYGSLADPLRKSYVHVISGTGRGFIVDIEEFRATDLRCSQTLSGWIAPGTQVLIRPHLRLADVFGADNQFGLAGGTAAEAADNVVAWDSQTQQERVYYFHSGRARWEEKGIEADASGAILRSPYGLFIVRRSPGNLRIALSGEISSNSVLLPVRTGANVFSLPINLSLSLDSLISSTGDFPVLSGPNSNQADLLTFEEPFTGTQRGPFYHSSRPGSSGWREIGEGSGNGVTLDLLSTLILHRDGPPGYVRAEGSFVPGAAVPVIPANPEPGEPPLYGYLPLVRVFDTGSSFQIQISKDLQNWAFHAEPTIVNNQYRFLLPAGQGRSFYRLKFSL